MKKKLFWILGMSILAGIIIVICFNFTGSNASQFKGPVLPGEPLPDALVSDLEKYVVRLMKQYDVPGVSMALVQGDRVVYARGLGVRDLRTREPVDTQTLMGIGSTTKSMTAVMIASMVDDGIITWDTHLTDILPTFTLSDPAVTEKMTFRHTLCMCSSVPEHKEAITVEYSELTAEDVIEMLATVPLRGSFEHMFNYSSPIVAAGGYIAAMANGGEYGDLAQAYYDEIQERLFDPLGMTSSTFSIEVAVASVNVATPYYSSLYGYKAILPQVEGVFTPIAPAGALWSNVDDLEKYLLMLLNDGVAPDDQRVVSHDNLEYLWTPQIAINSQDSYGLGWEVDNYHGLTVIHHPGGTVGFASELVIIPELDIGFTMLINRLDLVHPIGRMATYRLLEMLTGNEQIYDQEMRDRAGELEKQISALLLVTRKTMDPERIAPFLGSYHNDALGDIKLDLHDDHTLWIDFGEYESPIRPLTLEENQYIFFESVFVGKTIQMDLDSNGTPTMRWTGEEGTYNFIAKSAQK
jgi:CubicO group peptidase (beta-lactamase class C family)